MFYRVTISYLLLKIIKVKSYLLELTASTTTIFLWNWIDGNEGNAVAMWNLIAKLRCQLYSLIKNVINYRQS